MLDHNSPGYYHRILQYGLVALILPRSQADLFIVQPESIFKWTNKRKQFFFISPGLILVYYFTHIFQLSSINQGL